MMGHRQVEQAALFYEFSFERHIPANHLLRSIDMFVDLEDLQRELAPFYSNIGRPSIDPELVIRTLLTLRLRPGSPCLFQRVPGCLRLRWCRVVASVLPRRSIATPQYAMAQAGSCCAIVSNFRRAIRNQYECSIATPRLNSVCTLGLQDVGKVTVPSFWSCWPIASLARAAVIRPVANNMRVE
jgi:hypothetical protein